MQFCTEDGMDAGPARRTDAGKRVIYMLIADFARLAGRGVTDMLLTMRSYYNMQK